MCRQLMWWTGLLVGISILLSGCNGAKELDQRANVIAIGLDTGQQEGMFTVSYQLAIPKGESKGEGSEEAVVLTNTAASIAEARNLLSSEVAMQPVLAHAKIIVIGEALARKGLDKILGPFMRYREYRGTMYVVVTRGTAKSFFEQNKPAFVASMSKFYEQKLANGEEAGYFLSTTLHQYYARLKSNSGQPYMTFVAINPMTGEGHISTSKATGDKLDGYNAGDIPRQGGNAVDFAGVAMFDHDKMVATLSTTEARMLSMVLGRYSSGFIVVEDPLDSKSAVNVSLRLGSKPKISVTLVEGKPMINVHILLEGEITSIASGIGYEQGSQLDILEDQINKTMQQQMINMIKRTQEYNVDVAGFGYYLRPAFQSNKEFDDYKWNEKFNQAEVNVEVNTQIRRTGLMIRTVPIE